MQNEHIGGFEHSSMEELLLLWERTKASSERTEQEMLLTALAAGFGYNHRARYPYHLRYYLQDGDFRKPEYAEVPDQVLLDVAETVRNQSDALYHRLIEELLLRFPDAKPWYDADPNLSPICFRPLVQRLRFDG